MYITINDIDLEAQDDDDDDDSKKNEEETEPLDPAQRLAAELRAAREGVINQDDFLRTLAPLEVDMLIKNKVGAEDTGTGTLQ